MGKRKRYTLYNSRGEKIHSKLYSDAAARRGEPAYDQGRRIGRLHNWGRNLDEFNGPEASWGKSKGSAGSFGPGKRTRDAGGRFKPKQAPSNLPFDVRMRNAGQNDTTKRPKRGPGSKPLPETNAGRQAPPRHPGVFSSAPRTAATPRRSSRKKAA